MDMPANIELPVSKPETDNVYTLSESDYAEMQSRRRETIVMDDLSMALGTMDSIPEGTIQDQVDSINTLIQGLIQRNKFFGLLNHRIDLNDHFSTDYDQLEDHFIEMRFGESGGGILSVILPSLSAGTCVIDLVQDEAGNFSTLSEAYLIDEDFGNMKVVLKYGMDWNSRSHVGYYLDTLVDYLNRLRRT